MSDKWFAGLKSLDSFFDNNDKIVDDADRFYLANIIFLEGDESKLNSFHEECTKSLNDNGFIKSKSNTASFVIDINQLIEFSNFFKRTEKELGRDYSVKDYVDYLDDNFFNLTSSLHTGFVKDSIILELYTFNFNIVMRVPTRNPYILRGFEENLKQGYVCMLLKQVPVENVSLHNATLSSVLEGLKSYLSRYLMIK